MTTEVIVPFKKDIVDLEDSMAVYGIKLVCAFTEDEWPGEVGGVWQIEGEPEDLEQFVQAFGNQIAYC